MEAEGVVFRTGVNVGTDVSAAELLKEYDAVVLCCGAKKARPLPGADPEKIKGIYYAVDFLASTTKSLLSSGGRTVQELEKAGGYINAHGKNVVVVGGGDTGNDCIATVIRHGCKSVTALEMMVRKVDYGHEEAQTLFGHDPRVYETTVKEYHTDKKGCLKEIVTVKVCFDKDRKMSEVPGSAKTIPCDLLLIAAGFLGCEEKTPEMFGVRLSGRNTVLTKDPEEYQTNVPTVAGRLGDHRRAQGRESGG